MYALGAIVVSLLVLVVLLRLRIRIGLAMTISAVALAVLLGVTPGRMWARLVQEWHEQPLAETTPYIFVSLTALLLLVNVVGEAMGQIGLSAPMVREAGDKIGVERSRTAAINFFFRHQWEPVWPLFPAVPLIVVMLRLPAAQVVGYHAALSIAGVLAGMFFLLLFGIPPRKAEDIETHGSVGSHAKDFFHALWPILFTAVLYVGLNVPPAVGVFLAIIGLLMLHRVDVHRWGGIFKAAREPDMVLLLFGALWFKLNLEASGAIGSVVGFFQQMHMPPLLVLFLLPFLVSFSTGVTTPTVAITYPFLMPFIRTGDTISLGMETLAFAGIVFGLAVSPIHLCLALSASYFDTPLLRIVLRVLPPALCVAAAGLAVALLSA